MNIKPALDELYSREMSRYDFLKYVGVLFLSFIGVVGLMRTITHVNVAKPGVAAEFGYGSSSYGGFSMKAKRPVSSGN